MEKTWCAWSTSYSPRWRQLQRNLFIMVEIGRRCHSRVPLIIKKMMMKRRRMSWKGAMCLVESGCGIIRHGDHFTKSKTVPFFHLRWRVRSMADLIGITSFGDGNLMLVHFPGQTSHPSLPSSSFVFTVQCNLTILTTTLSLRPPNEGLEQNVQKWWLDRHGSRLFHRHSPCMLIDLASKKRWDLGSITHR